MFHGKSPGFQQAFVRGTAFACNTVEFFRVGGEDAEGRNLLDQFIVGRQHIDGIGIDDQCFRFLLKQTFEGSGRIHVLT